MRRFVRSVKRDVNRDPKEAKSSASFAGVRISPSKDGIAVKDDRLATLLGAALVDPDRSLLPLPTRVVRPKVTSESLEKRFKYFLAVSRSQRKLRFFVDRKLAKTYQVAIGAVGFATPAGLYEIRNKAVNPAWYVPNKPWAGDLAGKVIPSGDPENPIKAGGWASGTARASTARPTRARSGARRRTAASA